MSGYTKKTKILPGRIAFASGFVVYLAVQSVSAAPAGITPGVWTGGVRTTSNPFFICLNVSADGQRLTTNGTQCRGNQGQNQNSIEIQYQGGKTPEGAPCNGNSNRGLDFGDIQIAADGRINTVFQNSYVFTQITGKFFPAQNVAYGSVRTKTFGGDCSVSWSARPGAGVPPRAVPPPVTRPPTPPGAGGITPGRWLGGDQNTEFPFAACLNVAPEGNRLTAQNTKCRGNQGQNQNSIDIQFKGGVTPSGQTCDEYSYRNLEFGDISIQSDGSFATNFTNSWVNTTITGQFSGNTVSGVVRSVTRWKDCAVKWSAIPSP